MYQCCCWCMASEANTASLWQTCSSEISKHGCATEICLCNLSACSISTSASSRARRKWASRLRVAEGSPRGDSAGGGATGSAANSAAGSAADSAQSRSRLCRLRLRLLVRGSLAPPSDDDEPHRRAASRWHRRCSASSWSESHRRAANRWHRWCLSVTLARPDISPDRTSTWRAVVARCFRVEPS